MAEPQGQNRAKEPAQAIHQTQGKTDVPRTPETQHEMLRPDRSSTRGELTRDPFSMMSALRHEMDRLFEDFGFGGNLFRAPRLFRDLGRNSLWSPQIEVSERDGKLRVLADLPGLDKNDVSLEILDNALVIEGERRTEQRDERNGWSERSYGRFVRSIPLPEGINADTAKASFNNGVLEVLFDAPKPAQHRGKQIPIGTNP